MMMLEALPPDEEPAADEPAEPDEEPAAEEAISVEDACADEEPCAEEEPCADEPAADEERGPEEPAAEEPELLELLEPPVLLDDELEPPPVVGHADSAVATASRPAILVKAGNAGGTVRMGKLHWRDEGVFRAGPARPRRDEPDDC
jgi:hypothetical protein